MACVPALATSSSVPVNCDCSKPSMNGDRHTFAVQTTNTRPPSLSRRSDSAAGGIMLVPRWLDDPDDGPSDRRVVIRINLIMSATVAKAATTAT